MSVSSASWDSSAAATQTNQQHEERWVITVPDESIQLTPFSPFQVASPSQTNTLTPGATSIMLRSIPVLVTADILIEKLDSIAPGKHDFVSVPRDSRRNANVGLAFVNFVDHESAKNAFDVFLRESMIVARGAKPRVCQANVQGLAPNLAYFMAKTGHSAVNHQHGPKVFLNGRWQNVEKAVQQFVSPELREEAMRFVKMRKSAGSDLGSQQSAHGGSYSSSSSVNYKSSGSVFSQGGVSASSARFSDGGSGSSNDLQVASESNVGGVGRRAYGQPTQAQWDMTGQVASESNVGGVGRRAYGQRTQAQWGMTGQVASESNVGRRAFGQPPQAQRDMTGQVASELNVGRRAYGEPPQAHGAHMFHGLVPMGRHEEERGAGVEMQWPVYCQDQPQLPTESEPGCIQHVGDKLVINL